MGDIENKVIDIITEELKAGYLEDTIREAFRNTLDKAINESFDRYGGIKGAIEKKIESVMVPYIEQSDFTEYLPKLDTVLLDVINNTSVPDNKIILERFKNIMCEQKRESIDIDELFEAWGKTVAKDIEIDGLEVNYDDGVSYEDVEVTYEVEMEKKPDWSSFDLANLCFECEHDENVNVMVQLSKWDGDKKKGWRIRYDAPGGISSLRRLSDFEVLLMTLQRNDTRLIVDRNYQTDYVTPDAEPEATFQ